VWRVLGTLDALHEYDPGVTKAALLAGPSEGLGASRKCDLAPGGWFEGAEGPKRVLVQLGQHTPGG
jgi:hypothetical protein